MKKFNLQPLQHYTAFQFSAHTKEMVQRYWVKAVFVFLALFILLKKDISLEFTMHSARTPNIETQSQVLPAATQSSIQTNSLLSSSQHINQKVNREPVVENMAIIDLPSLNIEKKETESYPTEVEKVIIPESPKKEKKLKPKDENLANTFANLGFILNPTYAKRHKINPAIVAQKKRKCKNYVRRFSPIAIAEMRKYGIPASITLAQGLLESNAGESRLTKANSNHFGIKCFSKNCGKNHCSNFTDDTHKDFFRKYPNAWESYRAHSLFLQGSRYKRLKKLNKRDYKAWAKGLKKCGYATDKRYAEKLIQIIEALDLAEYDV